MSKLEPFNGFGRVTFATMQAAATRAGVIKEARIIDSLSMNTWSDIVNKDCDITHELKIFNSSEIQKALEWVNNET